jgi:hypothetical protein
MNLFPCSVATQPLLLPVHGSFADNNWLPSSADHSPRVNIVKVHCQQQPPHCLHHQCRKHLAKGEDAVKADEGGVGVMKGPLTGVRDVLAVAVSLRPPQA